MKDWRFILLGTFCLMLLPFVSAVSAAAQGDPTVSRFSFGAAKPLRGYTPVLPSMTYTDARGYGFEPGALVHAEIRDGRAGIGQSFVTSDGPYAFSVAVPEGNYDVTLTLGDRTGTSSTTVKAEVRRLMLAHVATDSGKLAERTITVNVRTAQIAGGGSVRLKEREKTEEFRNWDNKLTLEFSGASPCLDAVTITPVHVPTIYLAGDSTVTDQGAEPWSAWGQVLPSLFQPGIAVANYAESGETARSFIGAGRLAKILNVIQPGDYLLIQFAHNDMKEHGPGVGPYTTFAAALKQMVDGARAKGAFPVLLTPMNRRRFDSTGKIVNTFITTGPDGGDYVAAVRQVAHQENCPFIDLNAMSKILFETMGPEGTLQAFVHYPANTFPGQTKALKDDTHFNIYGAYELARCVAQGITDDHLPPAKFLRPGVVPFDPAHPDPVTVLAVPRDGTTDSTKPYGS
jgi:lysophospholipase L1-like esterase